MIIQVRQEGDDENADFYDCARVIVRGKRVVFFVTGSPDAAYESDTIGWSFDGNSLLLIEAKVEE